MELPTIIEKYRERLEKTLRPFNDITFTLEDTKPWESKLGGCPYLERLEDYPIGANERPMMFLAQLNLEEMPPLADFPTKGILQFYIEDEEPYGLEEACVVRYIESYSKEESKLVAENPFRENYQEYEPFDRNGKIHFEQKQMPVSTSVKEFEELFMEGITEDERNALIDVCYADGSRVGGYPYCVQDVPEYYEDSCDTLLLQLDVDDTCGLMFGDGGNCTFFISREDLLKHDFSQVEYDWQCC